MPPPCNQGKCHENVFQGVTGGRFQESSRSKHTPQTVNVNNAAQTWEMSAKGLPGHWRAVPGRFRMQAHPSGSVLVYVCVLNGHGSCANPNAPALRNPGTCHRNFFQGVTGGRFQESSRSEHLHSVNMNTMHKQEMSENVLPGGPLEVISRKVQKASAYPSL